MASQSTITERRQWAAGTFERAYRDGKGAIVKENVTGQVRHPLGIFKEDRKPGLTIIHLPSGKSIGRGTFHSISRYLNRIEKLADWDAPDMGPKDGELFQKVKRIAVACEIEGL